MASVHEARPTYVVTHYLTESPLQLLEVSAIIIPIGQVRRLEFKTGKMTVLTATHWQVAEYDVNRGGGAQDMIPIQLALPT